MSDKPGNKDEVQGEGDYKSAKKFDDAEQEFVGSGGVETAGSPAPKSADEAEDMERAEQTGRGHSKGEDPTIVNSKPRERDSR